MSGPTRFADRRDAGRRLAEQLTRYASRRPLIVALPRGGVPVAYEVARALKAPLDLLIVRKIGAPGQPELGLGAVVDGRDPVVVFNDEAVAAVQPTQAYLKAETDRQLQEIERRRHLYFEGRPTRPVKDRTVIVVDDGIATGGTARAALLALRRAGAAHLVLAVPVAPQDVFDTFAGAADEIVVLATPAHFMAVGAHYADFAQTQDSEVKALLASAADFGAGSVETG